MEFVSGGCGGTATERCLTQCAAEAARNGTSVITELQSLLTSGGPMDVMNGLCDAVVQGGREMAENALKSGFEVKVLFLTSVVVEVVSFGYNCLKAQQNYKAAVRLAKEHMRQRGNEERDMEIEEAEIEQRCKQERNKEIKEAACEAIGGVVGATALGAAVGSSLGSFCPGIGTIVGGLVGAIAGRYLGRLFSRWYFN